MRGVVCGFWRVEVWVVSVFRGKEGMVVELLTILDIARH